MQVGQLAVKIGVDTTQFSRGLQDVHKQMEATDANFKKVEKGAEAFKAVGAGVAGFGVVVAGGFGVALKAAADFESQMNSVKAVSGATGSEMKRLENLAIGMGAQTKFSAMEAGQGIEELIKAGVSVKDIIGGGLKGALDMAVAGDLELAESAEIASNALNAFRDDHLSVAQAGNILAGAANSSSASIRDLKYSLSMVSAVASGAGLSFKDTNVALAVLANHSLKGSDAGTSLKTMLNNLQPSTDKAAMLFERYGFQTLNASKAMEFLASKGIKPATSSIADIQKAMGDYIEKSTGAKEGSEKFNKAFKSLNDDLSTNAFYDANGNLKSMGEIAGILQGNLKNLTAQERQFALEQLFGSDAVRAATILYQEGAVGIEKMDKAMSKIKIADVVKEKGKGLKWTIEELKGSLETLEIVVGQKLLPIFTPFVKGLTSLLNVFISLPQPVQAGIIGFTGLAGGLALIAGPALMLIGFLPSISAGIGMVGAVIGPIAGGVVPALGAAFAAITGPIGLAVIAIALVAGAGYLIYKNWGSIGPFVKKTWETVKTFTVNLVGGAIDWLKRNWGLVLGILTGPIGLAVYGIATHWEEIKGAISTGVNTAIDWVKNNWTTIVSVLGGPVGLAAVQICKHWDDIKTGASTAWTGIKTTISGIWGGLTTEASKEWGLIKTAVSATWDWAKNNVSGTWNTVKSTISGSWSSLKGTASTTWGGITSTISGAWTWYKGTMASSLNTATAGIANKWAGLKSTASTAWNGIKGVISGAWAAISSTAKSSANGVIRAMNGMVSGLNRINFTIPDWVPGLGGKSFGLHIPHIPYLAAGGAIRSPGSVMVGEQGPEILHLPKGAVVEPLNKAKSTTRDFYGMFAGATIYMTSNAQAEAFARELYRLEQGEAKAAGIGRGIG